jgi:hypothetical protein
MPFVMYTLQLDAPLVSNTQGRPDIGTRERGGNAIWTRCKGEPLFNPSVVAAVGCIACG